MRFVVFAEGRLGLVDDDFVLDVTSLVPTPVGPAGPLHHLIESGDISGWSKAQLQELPRQPLSEVTLGAPLPRPPKIIGAPVNYLDHKAEMSETHSIEDLGVFLKASSSVIGPHDQVRLPYEDVRTDQEGELTVVIGRTARDVDVDSALDYVFGYTCGLDMTVRSTEDRSTRKSFDTFTPLGPVVVTADEIPDPGVLKLETRVNGVVRQFTSTKDLIFGVRELVAYASSVMTLWPGDVILTGTPAG
ncbi:MAG: FAA hydrolase family protein, partial [Comamonadaceae bacterium]